MFFHENCVVIMSYGTVSSNTDDVPECFLLIISNLINIFAACQFELTMIKVR